MAEATDTKKKRRWVAPAITSTAAAFEHAVLACNGTVPGRRGCPGKPGTTCQVVCTNAS